MNKVVVGVIITILAIGAIVGVVLVNKDDQKETTSNTTQQTASTVDDTQSTQTTPTDTTTDAVAVDKVTISNFSFSPSLITVKKGTTVTWTNQDNVSHTVTTDSGDGPKSELFGKGETFSYTFNDVGSYKYHCQPHPSMTGTVEVTE